MPKDKFDFIVELLSDKRIELSLKERVFELASKEIKDTLGKANSNSEHIAELEQKLSELKRKNTLETENAYSSIEETKPKSPLPNPQHTKHFLSYFRDSQALKYLTHDFPDIGNPISREILMQTALKEFNEAREKYPQTSDKLIRRVEEFAFKENPKWTIRKGEKSEEIIYGWSSKEFIEWHEKSIVKHPCRSSEWNKKMIEPFKKTIEIRDGLLLELIKESISLAFSKEDLELFELQYDSNKIISGRFLTDVDWLGQALYRILCGIKDKGDKQGKYNITIEYHDNFEKEQKCIKIIHHNSKPLRSSDFQIEKEGDFGNIRSSLWSLCNWAIEAEFTNGFRRKYILWDSSTKQKDFEIAQSDIKGFTHLLIFY